MSTHIYQGDAFYSFWTPKSNRGVGQKSAGTGLT